MVLTVILVNFVSLIWDTSMVIFIRRNCNMQFGKQPYDTMGKVLVSDSESIGDTWLINLSNVQLPQDLYDFLFSSCYFLLI
jgi:hypothetical protein